MKPIQGVSVEIISNGRPLSMYGDPDKEEEVSQSANGYIRQHYVQATTDAPFYVSVKLDEDFNPQRLGSKGSIQVRLEIDGAISKKVIYSCQEFERALQRRSHLTIPLAHKKQFDHLKHKWLKHGFAFAMLKTAETSASALSIKQAKKLGCIDISVSRVRRQLQDRPQAPSKTSYDRPTEVAEKAPKGRAINNIVNLTNGVPTETPKAITHKSVPLEGDAGKPMIFRIFYRSKSNLQSLGCIPRSPTPEQDLRQEVHYLRARLAVPERDVKPNVKSESSAAESSAKRKHSEPGTADT